MWLGKKISVKRLTLCSLLIALCFIFSFIEKMIPINFSSYGFKLGLANIVVVFALYKLPILDTLFILISKILISGLVFGGPVYFLFSLAGGLLSFAVMIIFKRRLGIVAVSVLGAVFFNVGQILVSCFMFSFGLIYYLPIMTVGSVFTGIIIGFLSDIAVNRIK